MYESFFGFREQPFSLLPDLRFLYLGEPQDVVLQALERGLAGSGGHTVITGESGCGKTILGKHLARSIGRGVPVESLSGAKALDVDLLLRALCAPAKEGRGTKQSDRIGLFSKHILAAYASEQSLLLILDEAQSLGIESLAKLHEMVLASLEEEQLLYLILFGRLDLNAQLAMPNLEKIAGGVVAGARIAPLDANETQAYIRHRLTVAGGNPELFTLGACARVFDHTEGVAGFINRLCELCLICGYDEGRVTIEENTVDEAAARGIQGVPFGDVKALLTEPDEGGQSQTRIASLVDDEEQMLIVEKSANVSHDETIELGSELDQLERDLEQTAAFASVARSGGEKAPRTRRELEELKQAIATLPTLPTAAIEESPRADLRVVQGEELDHPRNAEQAGTVVLPPIQRPRNGTLPTIRLDVSESRESAAGLNLRIEPTTRIGTDPKARPRRSKRLSKMLILGVSFLLSALVLLLIVDRNAVQSLVTRVTASLRAYYDVMQSEVTPSQETAGEAISKPGSNVGVVERPSTDAVRDAARPPSSETEPRPADYWIALVYEAWAASELELALQYVAQGLRDEPDNIQLQALAKALRADLNTESQ